MLFWDPLGTSWPTVHKEVSHICYWGFQENAIVSESSIIYPCGVLLFKLIKRYFQVAMVAWMITAPTASYFRYLVPSWWNCLRRISRSGIVGGDVSQGGGALRFLKSTSFPVSSHSLVTQLCLKMWALCYCSIAMAACLLPCALPWWPWTLTYYVYVCVPVWVYVNCMHVCTLRGQRNSGNSAQVIHKNDKHS